MSFTLLHLGQRLVSRRCQTISTITVEMDNFDHASIN